MFLVGATCGATHLEAPHCRGKELHQKFIPSVVVLLSLKYSKSERFSFS